MSSIPEKYSAEIQQEPYFLRTLNFIKLTNKIRNSITYVTQRQDYYCLQNVPG